VASFAGILTPARAASTLSVTVTDTGYHEPPNIRIELTAQEVDCHFELRSWVVIVDGPLRVCPPAYSVRLAAGYRRHGHGWGRSSAQSLAGVSRCSWCGSIRPVGTSPSPSWISQTVSLRTPHRWRRCRQATRTPSDSYASGRTEIHRQHCGRYRCRLCVQDEIADSLRPSVRADKTSKTNGNALSRS
jgi:hypothetical protein